MRYADDSIIGKSALVVLKAIDEIDSSEPGSEERASAIKTYEVLMNEINNAEKMEIDQENKERSEKVSVKDIVKWILYGSATAVTFVSAILNVYMGNRTLELEETGMLKTSSSRKWLIGQKWPKGNNTFNDL